MTTDVFITGLGKFFPGPPIPNDQLEDYLGLIHGRPARAKGRVLAQNGIQTRHYALDRRPRARSASPWCRSQSSAATA